jgi:phosphoribosylamine--glycine ligase
MNLLIVDTDGVGLALAWRAVQAGHSVRWFVKPKPCNNPDTGKGFRGITRIDNWVGSVKWADLVFTTSNDDYLKRLDFFKKNGAMVYAPSQKSADLEIKRAQGMQFLKRHGIDVPPYKTFPSLKEAEAYVWKNERRFVFKTLGDNEDKSLSYCGKSPADMIARLQLWQKIGMNPKGEVMLQEFIEGTEMGVSRWMGSAGWVGAVNENFEHKKLMPGNGGPNTGEMGTVSSFVEKSKLFDDMLEPIKKPLMDLDHLGDVDLNCIIDDKGKAWPLEFTNRPGWPIFNQMLAATKGDPIQWMVDALRGKDTLESNMEPSVCVVLAQPDFPYGNLKKEEISGIPIYGVTKKNQKYIQPQSVQMMKLPDMDGETVVERPIWATSGDYLAVVTGFGKTIKQAMDRAYKTVDEISVPNMIYRNDIGAGLKDKIPKLHAMGYATHFNFE